MWEGTKKLINWKNFPKEKEAPRPKPRRAKKTAARSIASSQKGKNYQLWLVTTKSRAKETQPQKKAMRTNCPMRGKTELKESKANWADQEEPSSQKKARLPREGRGGEERTIKLRNKKDNVKNKRVENLAETAILVGEKAN